MRILLLTQLFQPEPNFLKGLAFACALRARGHQVQVLTGLPNYPSGRVYSGYRWRPIQREVLGGIEVVRVGHYPSHDRSAARRIASYLSFAGSAAVLGTGAVERPDVIHVYQGPATLMLSAAVLATVRRARIVLDIQDLWPESVTGSGMLKRGLVERALQAFCGWTYRRADRIVVLSRGFAERLARLGVPREKIDVVYNWCDEAAPRDATAPADLLNALPTGKFSLVYAGTMGPHQGLGSVVEAARLLTASSPEVHFVLVGEGIEGDALRRQAAGLPNVTFLPRQPAERTAHLLARADALLIHLKADDLARWAIPQKTQAYLAAGRPIVVGVDGEASELVEQAGAGLRCRAGDPADIARAVREMAALSPAARETMGRLGRDYYARHLSFERGVGKMAAVLESVVETGSRA